MTNEFWTMSKNANIELLNTAKKIPAKIEDTTPQPVSNVFYSQYIGCNEHNELGIACDQTIDEHSTLMMRALNSNSTF